MLLEAPEDDRLSPDRNVSDRGAFWHHQSHGASRESATLAPPYRAVRRVMTGAGVATGEAMRESPFSRNRPPHQNGVVEIARAPGEGKRSRNSVIANRERTPAHEYKP
jgi:hypothetical protein